MKFVIQQIDHHMVGHCDCCDGYRALEYFDRKFGCLCFRCIDHLMVADIELNHGGYSLCRPEDLIDLALETTKLEGRSRRTASAVQPCWSGLSTKKLGQPEQRNSQELLRDVNAVIHNARFCMAG